MDDESSKNVLDPLVEVEMHQSNFVLAGSLPLAIDQSQLTYNLTPIPNTHQYVCEVCNASFKYPCRWKQHIKIHDKLTSTDAGQF